ncbi:MAG: alcohol dehydrogenase catalytic domain-containing protein [Thermocrispum sp.]
MRAVVVEEFGDVDLIKIGSLPVPRPARCAIRIRVAAAAVNPTDLMLRSGALADYVRHLRPPHVLGMDASGSVDAIGEAASVDWPRGTPVMAFANPFSETGGAQAEFVVVPASQVAALPDSIDPVEAAGLPMNGLTADLALRLVDLPAGATLGVTGGAGALGGYAIQLASTAGFA